VNDTFTQHIIDVCHTQDTVNRKSLGDDWKYQGYKQEDVDYAFAAIDEISEFWRSALHYKWWAKAKEQDIDNAITELVDILHFGVSQDLIHQHYFLGVKDDAKAYQLIAKDAVRSADRARANFDYTCKSGTDTQIAMRRATKELLAGFTAACIEDHDVFMWDDFWELTYLIGATPELIVSRYKAKAQLNLFRQANGYKDGTYKKYWKDGREDNAFLSDYLKTLQAYPGDEEIQKWLTANYLLCTAPTVTAQA
jgi:hypothetical protein